MEQRYVVIMAGGRGERFWPQSRMSQPKHLLPIVGEEPMLAQTVARLNGLVGRENIFIITGADQREAVCRCCPELPEDQVVAEPMGRDTAAAVALAATLVGRRDPRGVFAILPADHVIGDAGEFRAVLETGFEAAAVSDVLLTIGIRPTGPATGYGYIRRGRQSTEVRGRAVYAVERFVEKPDLATAQSYLEDGGYLWNAGMFVWSVGTVQSALARHAPAIQAGMDRVAARLDAGSQLGDALAAEYPSLEKISIDYALLEKAANVVMIEATFAWDDVGEWPAVMRHYPTDADGNVVRGDAVVLDSHRNLVVGAGGRTIALLGVDDLIVVDTGDALLICPRSRAQNIKQLVTKVGERHPELL